jgi:hypothetical protein
VRHAEVVGVEDEEPRARRVAQPLREARAGAVPARRRRKEGEAEKRGP